MCTVHTVQSEAEALEIIKANPNRGLIFLTKALFIRNIATYVGIDDGQRKYVTLGKSSSASQSAG